MKRNRRNSDTGKKLVFTKETIRELDRHEIELGHGGGGEPALDARQPSKC